MDINAVSQLMSGINNNEQQNQPIAPPPPPTTPLPTAGEAAGTDFGAAGTYQQGVQPQEAQTFTVDRERVNALWAQHEARVESFRQMVETLFGQQAERQGIATNWQNNLQNIEITDEMRAEAEEMIQEGGYFSVDETAARILDFAVALTGGDPGRIELMRDAVQRGFDQAERMFGGELPQISHDTHEAVMNGFDEWQEAGNAAAITLLNRGE
ncbi:MAG: hypothetical protein FWF77_02335 [Defluviitaleaceae bacterium]|nr:hypothetical protein [Defluviitaleaceae bacterium]